MDEEDDYVYFGTSLPDIEDEATLKRKAAKELQVCDEKGRQRFHGAFTGGFSAGYFNTVGTKEGWAPSSFVSSRTKNADRIQQNPEDFMDDEDFGEFGIATRRIHTTSNFQEKSDIGSQKRNYADIDAIIPGEAPLKDIVQPVRESIGIQILRKLGWRHGQGIGPRVKKQQPGSKVYGCALFPGAAEVEEDPTAMLFTFAPQDIESLYYKPKDDYFGLGYKGLSKESVLSARTDPFALTSTKSFLAKEKKKLSISGQAFGVGAFEDDDDDIYSKDDLSQYDFSDLTLQGTKDPQKAIESKKSGKSNDVIEGFCLASKPLKIKKHYPAPSLPLNFKPIHVTLDFDRKQTGKNEKTHHTLTASDRSLMLGEKKFCKPSSSDANIVPTGMKKPDQESSFMRSPSSLNFRPFPKDAAKQQRYENYIRLKEQGDIGKLVQPASMTEWEKQQEIEEFAKAAVLFKPLANVLSSRFESKSHLSVEHEVISELEKIKKEKEKKLTVPVKKKLIGRSNRKTFEWHPVSLLCKRMNVPNPYPNDNLSGVKSIVKTNTVFNHLLSSEEKVPDTKIEVTLVTPSNTIHETKTAEDAPKELSLPTVLTFNTPSTYENRKVIPTEDMKPPIDFFKDIFANSSSDEESEDEKTKESDAPKSPKDILPQKDNTSIRLCPNSGNDQEMKEKQLPKDCNVIDTNSPRQKVGFGVFANLDLDALNERKPAKPKILHTGDNGDDAKSVDSNKVDDSVKIIDEWTPELPPNFKIPRSPVSNDFKVEYRNSEKHKSKHKHKHKHHKHKSKKKKKKCSKHESSSGSEEELYEAILPMVMIEKLKELQKKDEMQNMID